MLDNVESKIRSNIASVFSVLPSQAADGAEQQLLEHFLDNSSANKAMEVKWVEFKTTGNILRSGCTDLNDLSTHFFANTNADEDIELLYSKVKNQLFQVGAIEKIANKEAFIWFISLPKTSYQDKKTEHFKALIINEAVFSHTLESFNSDANLTKAEKRIIFQLICGCSLNEAATIDSVTVETKRSQLKLVFNKLQCNNQASVTRMALSQMTYLASLTLIQTANRDASRTAELFAHHYFPNTVHYSQRQLSNGNILRFFECGPLDGKPVVLIHGFIFPLILSTCSDYLKKYNIRLIMPLRHGFLENSSMTELYKKDHALNQSIEDIACFIRQYFNNPIPIIGQAFGAAISIRLASLYPNLFSQMICASLIISKPQEYHSKIIYNFYHGLNQLLSKPGMFRMIAWQFRKYYVNTDNVKPAVEKIYVSIESDKVLLNKKIGGHPAYSWLTDSFRSSVIGIAEDFAFTMDDTNFKLDKVQTPTLFIHGRKNTLTTQDTLENLKHDNPYCDISYIEEGGYLAFGSHPDIFWETVAKRLQIADS